jgi:uncharacterized delta-60 repeat protein
MPTNAAPVVISTAKLDPVFSGDGLLSTPIGTGDDKARAVAVDVNGNLVIVGYSAIAGNVTDFAVIRVRPDGILDTSFSSDGKLTTSFTGKDEAHGVAIQTDGKILVVGTSNADVASDIALVRYNTDGSLDSTFGTTGKVSTNIQANDDGAGIALGADGKIYVVGTSNTSGTAGNFNLLRYNSNGTLDSTFGSSGIASVTGFNGNATSLVAQADGKILVAGSVWNGANYDVGVARFNTDGTLDSSFSDDGTHTIGWTVPAAATNDSANAIALQTDGKIVLAGDAYTNTDGFHARDGLLIRLNANGTIDTGFGGGDGIVDLHQTYFDSFSAVLVQADGKVIVGGEVRLRLGEALLARFNSDGTLDTSFDSDGILSSAFGDGPSSIQAMTFSPNGQLVAAGDSNTGTYDFGSMQFGTGMLSAMALAGQAYNYTIPAGSVVDPEAGALSYTATLLGGASLPSWLSFNAQTRTFSGTPDDAGFGTYRIAIAASDGTASTTATVDLEVTTTFIESLRYTDHARWNDTVVSGTTGTTLTFSFMQAVPTYIGPDEVERSTFFPMNTAERQAVREVLASYQEIAGLSFVEVASAGTLNFGAYSSPADGTYAYAYQPGADEYSGDVWVNRYFNTGTTAPGSYHFETLLHEVGHALGFKHPGNYGPTDEPPYFDLGTKYSVMSYYGRSDDNYPYVVEVSPGNFTASNFFIHASTPMLDDIATIQFIYGANTATRAGNDVYTFDPATPFFRTLWDGGGIDTISVANFSTANIIDLHGGNFSSIVIPTPVIPPGYNSIVPTYRGTDNLAIAYGVIIENVIGGSGNDHLIGNAANNQFTGGGGDDNIEGGAGDDTAIFNGSFAQYTVTVYPLLTGYPSYAISDGMFGRDGFDTFRSVEFFRFSDGLRSAAQLVTSTPTTVSAYTWKSHALLPGVEIINTAGTQTTGQDGSVQLSGVAGPIVMFSTQRAVPTGEASSTSSAVNLQDAIAILKMIVGLDVNGAGKPLSAYQAIAADFDGSGQVNLNDAISVLKHVVGLSAPAPTWRFVDELDPGMSARATLAPGTTQASIVTNPILTPEIHVGLVGILSGDVDGSFAGAAGSQILDVAYFQTLTNNGAILPLAQFGIYA